VQITQVWSVVISLEIDIRTRECIHREYITAIVKFEGYAELLPRMEVGDLGPERHRLAGMARRIFRNNEVYNCQPLAAQGTEPDIDVPQMK